MPRLRRELIEGGMYHVYNRFARGEEVFGDPGEAIGFIDRLHETNARDGLSVFAWTLTSNHFHLAIRTSAVPLSRTMHSLQNGFSRSFNRRSEQFIALACECLRVDPEDVASRRQDSATGRLRRLIASCGVERWGQRAGHLAAVLKKHPVVVSRWVGEAGKIRIEDDDFAGDLESLDQSLSTRAIERLAELRAAERQS